MLNPFGEEKLPGSNKGFQKRILHHWKADGLDDKMVDMLRRAYDEALNAEHVMLTRGERTKLLSDVLNTFFEEVMRRFRGRGES
jgi:hypothetical protein